MKRITSPSLSRHTIGKILASSLGIVCAFLLASAYLRLGVERPHQLDQAYQAMGPVNTTIQEIIRQASR
ncbi:hypothetical protein [Pelagicoccus albus]|uniref:Uncharacterized protein n=1 Tax=Pelagicoccus albus TaxID=415222 RepID=A0A7X1B5V7_9BACT|nr:hypothetical protein [Pelagicoccus albus]MBC2606218.1 hypothetical protein [Pelagicoccus albus]